ncbi:MAG: methyltransferase [Sphingomonadales bacterium]|nr:MAG: methyltransferase [Sphingomonadales bacterium]
MPASTAAERRSRRRAAGLPSPAMMFLKGFVKHPVMVGAIASSSQRLVRHVLSRVDWGKCKLFVEYGPGVGTFTRPVLERLAPDGKLIVIDTNPDFIAYLNATIDDSRLIAICGSASDVKQMVKDHGFEHADYIASGLPFSTLPTGVGDAIAKATSEIIRPGGAFLVYQYNPKVRNFFAPYFPRIDHAVEWWNLPPAQLWWAWKD